MHRKLVEDTQKQYFRFRYLNTEVGKLFGSTLLWRALFPYSVQLELSGPKISQREICLCFL